MVVPLSTLTPLISSQEWSGQGFKYNHNQEGFVNLAIHGQQGYKIHHSLPEEYKGGVICDFVNL